MKKSLWATHGTEAQLDNVEAPIVRGLAVLVGNLGAWMA